MGAQTPGITPVSFWPSVAFNIQSLGLNVQNGNTETPIYFFF